MQPRISSTAGTPAQEQHSGALRAERDTQQQQIRSLTQQLSEAHSHRDAVQADLSAGTTR